MTRVQCHHGTRYEGVILEIIIDHRTWGRQMVTLVHETVSCVCVCAVVGVKSSIEGDFINSSLCLPLVAERLELTIGCSPGGTSRALLHSSLPGSMPKNLHGSSHETLCVALFPLSNAVLME